MSTSRSRFLMAVVVSSLLTASAGAEDLAASVAAKLRDSGALNGYRVHVKAKSGTVWLEGTVSDETQIAAAVGVTETMPGVERVVNRLVVQQREQPEQAALGVPATAWDAAGLEAPAEPLPEAAPPAAARGPSLNPLAVVSEALFPAKPAAVSGSPALADVQLVGNAAPVKASKQRRAGPPQGRAPLPLAVQGGRPMRAPAAQAGRHRTAMRTSGIEEPMMLPGNGLQDGEIVPGTMQFSEGGPVGPGMQMPPVAGGPVPMAGTGVGMPPVPMRGNGPNMPNYAWPSYAAYPNYAALQYPTQYSPTAWPYIGPFYPYPQVPLGWRRVSLEWDDGWWWLDFDERHYHTHH